MNLAFSFFGGIKNFFHAIYRDICGILLLVQVEFKLGQIERKQLILSDIYRRLVKNYPSKACIIFNDDHWSYERLEHHSNQIAEVFTDVFGLKKGDCVALLMENRPEYVSLWLGLSKIGVISALINTNLKYDQLAHTINMARPKIIVYSDQLENALETCLDQIDKDVILVNQGHSFKQSVYNLDKLVKNASGRIVEPSEKIVPNDIMMYVYTSGTTGLPKPAVIKFNRYIAGGLTFSKSAYLGQNDRLLVSLPLYHANGGIIGVGSALVSGVTVVLRKKFSASNFWKECIYFKCTAFIYVGEICRFLINQPKSLLDKQHGVRKAIGNGLRQNVWEDFYARFGVNCVEFYAASEGNCTMINTVSKIGACGFVPLINRLFKVLPIYLIKIDDEMNPIRDKNGFCIECRPYEKGLLVGMIGKSIKSSFNGYANNKTASNKKIIENVFKTGQRAFNSGDLMMCDNLGYLYFCDRLGDTFRWKGENVATIEIENVLSKILDGAETSVYGVEILGQEGKAGMVAINRKSIDFDYFEREIKLKLPSYARPVFIRLLDQLDYTGTFKTKKTRLVQEGFDIKKTNDKIYYFSISNQSYKELTQNDYQDILKSNIRF